MHLLLFLLFGLGLLLCSPSLALSQSQPVDVHVLDVLEEVDVNVLRMPSQCSATTHNGCSCTGDKVCTKNKTGRVVTCESQDNSQITCQDTGATCTCS
jgi:hypothetical protein